MLSFSHDPILITYHHIKAGKVACLEMQGPQQNVFSTEFMAAIHRKLSALCHDRSVCGVILTSTWNGKFSSGPDIKALMYPKKVHFRKLYDMFFWLFVKAFLFPKPLIAAINGDCPSFACALAMACDERVMARGPSKIGEKVKMNHTLSSNHSRRYKVPGNEMHEGCNILTPFEVNKYCDSATAMPAASYTIGFPDPTIAMVLPRWVTKIMANIIGPKNTEYQLRYGHMWSSQQALNIGLVDALCPPNETLKVALRRMQAHAQVDNHIWQSTKYSLRGNMAFSVLENTQRHVSRTLYSNHFFRTSSEIQNRIQLLRK